MIYYNIIDGLYIYYKSILLEQLLHLVGSLVIEYKMLKNHLMIVEKSVIILNKLQYLKFYYKLLFLINFFNKTFILVMVEKKFIHQASSQVWTHSKSTTIHQITNRTVVANEINCSTSNDEVFFCYKFY